MQPNDAIEMRTQEGKEKKVSPTLTKRSKAAREWHCQNREGRAW